MKEPTASKSQHGGQESDDEVIRFMREGNVPITRENYLHVAYFGQIPDPWTAEHEADLPEHLQDWENFKYA